MPLPVATGFALLALLGVLVRVTPGRPAPPRAWLPVLAGLALLGLAAAVAAGSPALTAALAAVAGGAVAAHRAARPGPAAGPAPAADEELSRSRLAAAATERRYAALAESIPQLVWAARADGGLVDANRRWAAYTGYAWEDSLGLRWQDLVHPDDLPTALARWQAAAAARAAFEAEYRLRRHDGAYRWHIHRAVPAEDPATGAVRWYGTSTDVDDQRRTRDALRDREALLRAVVAHIPGGVYWKDRDSVYLGCNDRFARDCGLGSAAAVVGKTDRDLPHRAAAGDAHRERDRRVMAAGRPLLDAEEAQARPDGSTAALLASVVPLRDAAGAVVGVLGVYQDVTERRRLEERVRQAEKMEAVGRLAGGVAHDFNNLLTAMNGFCDLALDDLPPGHPVRGMVGEVRRAGERAADLTRQLLAFGRRQVVRVQTLDLAAVVADMHRMLARVIGEDVRLVVAPGPGPALVAADPGQVEQVVMNLAVNARDAMPTGGTLTIATGAADLGRGKLGDSGVVRPGRYVTLSVSDTGAGLSAEARRHLFEPFFTTKGPGKGTGLGLATVYAIVRQSGGHIDVRSEAGRGTTFCVYLPAAPARGPAAPEPAAASDRGGTETVLLVEDEAGVRELARAALERKGYRVLAAATGEEAAELARRAGGAVGLLVTDVVMPGAGGRAVADRLAAAHPGLRVLFMSGYTDDAVLRHGVAADRVNFIQKPFTPAALAAKVRAALDAPPGPDAGSVLPTLPGTDTGQLGRCTPRAGLG